MNEEFAWLGPAPEEYKFYGGEITLYFDEKAHSYFRYHEDNQVFVPGVSTVVGVYDKSAQLMQWAANMTAEYIAEKCDQFPSADSAYVREWLDAARFNHRDYKENAADIGKIAHGWIEDYIRWDMHHTKDITQYGVPYPESLPARNGVIASLDWMRKHKVRWLFTERKIYSHTHDYAGTKDGLAFISSCGDPECCGQWVKRDGRWCREAVTFVDALALIDWKTSNHLHASYWWQTAGYLKAMEEEIGVHSDHPELDQEIKYRVVVRLGKDDAKFEAQLLMPDTLERDFATFLNCLALYRSVDVAEEEDKLRRKEIRMQGREDRLTLACAKSGTYKGFRFPKCNGGNPCAECLRKFNERHPQESPDDAPLQTEEGQQAA